MSSSPPTPEPNSGFERLVSILQSFPSSIFDPFTIHRAHYESSGIQIGVDILVPKTLPSPALATRPVIVRIHGGFLVTGSSLFPGWFSNWILLYAAKVGAIIVSPNYRLLPEVTGRDVLDDMKEFWAWFDAGGPRTHLVSIGRADIALQQGNEEHLLIGESAGGYLAIQSMLSGYTRPRALITMYPMLDLRSEYYTRAFSKPIVGVANIANEVIDRFLSRSILSSSLASSSGNERLAAIVTEADPPHRLDLALAMVQNGRVLEFLGVKGDADDDPTLFPLERIAQNQSQSQSGSGSGSACTRPLFPPTLLMHGSEDTAVPVSGTRKFVSALRDVDPGCDLRVVIRPGDHGFDAGATLETPWLAEALGFVSRVWLGSDEGVAGGDVEEPV
ncbi:Alpha/Beta hydrolase protein [Aspergillus carlsbadensis]|nr:Alpha/Beta hydrolase protein [Aspergillus carlsbadensis]